MRYVNPQTGAERESTTRLDYPWRPVGEPATEAEADSVEQTTSADIAPGVAEKDDLTVPGEHAHD